jgi:hypothetical protein
LARDFKAEAIAAKQLAKEQERQAQKYHARPKQYEFKRKPDQMTTEAWRQECEVRYILHGIATQEQRRRFFAKVGEIRGEEARRHLEGQVMALWQKERRA